MKFILSLLFVSSVILQNNRQIKKSTITASVINVTSDSGFVAFALYNKSSFRIQPIQSKRAIIISGVSTVIFDNVAQGEYAVVCYHDKNNNNTMDFEPNGIPLEDYGASNNVNAMGPPKYHDAKFIVTDKNVTLKIRF